MWLAQSQTCDFASSRVRKILALYSCHYDHLLLRSKQSLRPFFQKESSVWRQQLRPWERILLWGQKWKKKGFLEDTHNQNVEEESSAKTPPSWQEYSRGWGKKKKNQNQKTAESGKPKMDLVLSDLKFSTGVGRRWRFAMEETYVTAEIFKKN